MTCRCSVCDKLFTRRGKRGPIPKYCSGQCARAPFKERKREYDAEYHVRYMENPENRRRKREYGHEYNRRPRVRERQRLRMLIRWHTDPEYRERQRRRWNRTVHPEVEVAAPYTGHRWLDRARMIVKPYVDPRSFSADHYYDEMGEALLALLEGRDPEAAVREYRRKEWPARNLTVYIGDWEADHDNQERFWPTPPLYGAIELPEERTAEPLPPEPVDTSLYVASKFKNAHGGYPKAHRVRKSGESPSHKPSSRKPRRARQRR